MEGETEKKLVNTLKIVGKVQIQNLWEIDLTKIIARIRADIVYIIFDTDRLENINRFRKNLQILKQAKIEFRLIQQTKNMEDEIVKCSDCKKIEEVFQTQSVKDFKREWLKCQNLEKKLADINFNSSKLWTGKLIAELSQWQTKQKSFQDLSLKK